MTLVEQYHNERKKRLARFANAAAALKAQKQAKAEASITEQMKEAWIHIEDEPCVPTYLSINEIQSVTCEYFHISLAQLLAKSRHHPVLIPRQIAMYLCGKHTQKGPSDIGRRFGNMDHSTVISACWMIEKKIRNDWKVAFDVAHIEGQLA